MIMIDPSASMKPATYFGDKLVWPNERASFERFA